MCGICGVVSLNGPLDSRLAAALPAMNDTLRHRGPDDGRVFGDAHAGLGHRRLSIIDRGGGAQPLANEDGSRWVVFNGEIYNHHDLRRTLVGGALHLASELKAIARSPAWDPTTELDTLERWQRVSASQRVAR